MSDFEGTTRAQTDFLRLLKNDPLGVTVERWPSALVLRRWMQQPAFKRWLATLQMALQVQADLHLTAATAQAAMGLQKSLAGGFDEGTRSQLSMLVSLLRMAHQRLRHVDQLKQYRTTHPKPRRRSIIHPSHSPEKRQAFLRMLASQSKAQGTPKETA